MLWWADTDYTEVLNPRRACVRESLKLMRILIMVTGSIRKTLGKRWRLNRKKLATLHQVVFQVELSLLLAVLGPLEGSAVEKVPGMSLQYPTTQAMQLVYYTVYFVL